MKKYPLILSFLCISVMANAQFNQKISIRLSPGVFKTIGDSGVDTAQMQMPNYKMGFSANGGVQYKISNKLSLTFEGGIMISTRWKYKGENIVNDLSWSIDDTITLKTIETGQDYLDIYNYSFGIKLKYYFQPENKWDPYFFVGANINWTRSFFDNAEWAAYKALGWPGYNEPTAPNDNLESSFGPGFNPGLGLEYSPADRIHLYLEPSYYLIILTKKNFKHTWQEENFHAILFQFGLRFNFLKSKDL